MEICKGRRRYVAITSNGANCCYQNENVMTDIDKICETYFCDTDVVLADGFTQSDKPRIIVVENEADAGIFERGCRVISLRMKYQRFKVFFKKS